MLFNGLFKMLLTELTGIKNQSDKSLNDLIIDFIAKNYKKIGIGSFGATFDNPKKPNEVIKFWIKDPAYEEYINFALKHPSKHFLKVYKTGELILNLNDQKIKLKYTKIEKLDRTEMFDSFSSGIELSEVLYFIESVDLDILKLPHILDLATNEFNKNGKLPDDVSEFIINVYSLHKALGDKHNFDLDTRNVLKRGNDFVIADPYYSFNSVPLTDVLDKNTYWLLVKQQSNEPIKNQSVSLSWD